MRQALLGSAALVLVTGVPLVAYGVRHDGAGAAAVESRPIAADDTTPLSRILRAVRGSDPLLCEMAVRNVDMHGSWSHWGPISGDPLETDTASAAIIRWIQRDHADPRLVPPLAAALHDADACVRRVAGSFLGRIDHPSARATLMRALDDASAGTREVAALGLGLAEVKGGDAVQPLIARLRDGSADVRRAAAWALGSIEDTAATQPLIDVLQGDSDPRVRQTAAWAIGNAAK